MIFWGGIDHSSTSVILELPIYRSDTGQGMTGLTNSSTGLSIAHSYDNNAGAVDTSAATSSIETVGTLFTYAAPTSGFVRFREVEATNKPGAYQLMFEDSVFAQSASKDLFININGVTDMMDMQYHITLDVITLADIVAELATYGVPTVTEMNARTIVSAEYATSAELSLTTDSIDAVGAKLPNELTPLNNLKVSIEEVAQDVEIDGGTATPVTKNDV